MLPGAVNLEDWKSSMLNFQTHFLYIVFELICILKHPSTLYSQDEVFSIKTLKAAHAQTVLPSSFPRKSRAEPRISAQVCQEFLRTPYEKITQECFYITAKTSEPCQNQGQTVSDAGQKESYFKKTMFLILRMSR